MVRHSVIFNLKFAVNSVEGQDFFTAAKLLADIPGVKNFECLKQTSKKNNFDFGLSMEFADQSLYNEYSNHSNHILFIHKYWLANVAGFLEIDFEPLD